MIKQYQSLPKSADSPQVSQQEEELKRTINRLLIQLERSKHKTEDLVNAVYRAAHEAASALIIKPVKSPPKDPRRSKHEEVAIVVVSDWQLAKRTPTYNSIVCEKRVEEYAEKVINITRIQRADHPVRKCHLLFLGDMLESELIFPGQEHRIDASLYKQLCVDGPRIVCNLVRTLESEFDEVIIDCCQGNHGNLAGRQHKNMHPESNADLMLYTICKDLLENEPNVTFNLPYISGERAWYTIVTVGRHRFFIFHGDQMRGGGYAGIPMYGFARAINNWASGVIPGGFTAAICGHWHQSVSMPYNDRILWVNGSTESGNTWLQEELKVQCPPSQWLLFCHPERGVTSEHRIWLT